MTVAFQNGSFLSGAAGVSSMTQSGGLTASSLFNTEYLDKKYSYNDTQESYEIGYAGKDAVLSTKISNIISQLEKGHEDKALSCYQDLVSEMAKQERYSSVAESPEQLKAIARQLIEEAAGCDLEELIVNKASNAFERGFEINWNGDKATEEDLLFEMCAIDNKDRLTGLKKVAGSTCKVAAGTAAGAAAGAAIGAIGGPIGAGIGALIGGGLSLLSGLL